MPFTAGGVEVGLRERKRAQTVDTIVSTALRLFVEKGYAATTVDDIADAAVVSRATVFRYFPSKEEILFSDFAAADDVLCDACIHHKDRSYGAALRRAVIEFASTVVTSDSAMPERMSIIDSNPRLLARSLLAEQQWAQTIVRELGDPEPTLEQEVLAFAAMRAARVAMRQWGGDRSGDFESRLGAALDVLRLPKR